KSPDVATAVARDSRAAAPLRGSARGAFANAVILQARSFCDDTFDGRCVFQALAEGGNSRCTRPVLYGGGYVVDRASQCRCCVRRFACLAAGGAQDGP